MDSCGRVLRGGKFSGVGAAPGREGFVPGKVFDGGIQPVKIGLSPAVAPAPIFWGGNLVV